MLRRLPSPRSSATAAAPSAAVLALAFWAFGACTTEDPREHFRTAAPIRPIGSGGSLAQGGNAGGSRGGSTGRAGGQGPSEAGRSASTGGAGGAGASGGSGTHLGDSGEAGATHDAGRGGTGASGGTSGSSGASGSGASAGSGAGGSGPVDDCGDRPVTTGAFSKQALRAAAADCAVWHYCKFEATAERLETSALAQAAEPTPERLERAQADFRAAMSAWSAVELFQFGPLSSRAESEGKDIVYGQGLREFVYSWPRFTRCRIEEQILTRKYQTQGFPNVPIAGRGLFGIEYLLFYPGADTACSATSSTAADWAALDPAELTARKHQYLAALATDVVTTTRGLLDLWNPGNGNFRDTFVNAVGYADEQQALTILAWSLVYLEREVKDWKLGVPLGVTLTHPVTSPEAPYALVGTDNIRQNLRGFRALFQGCGESGEGLGFDDWLSEAGHAALGEDIVRALDAAEAFTSTFPALNAAAPEELENLYLTIKAVTDLLKSDLFGTGSPLNLELPDGVAGDTD